MKSSMLKKAIVSVASLAMMMSAVTAVTAAPTSETDAGRLRFYANGEAIILAQGTTEGNTVVYLDANKNGKVDESEAIVEISNASGKADESGYDLSDFAIFGGAKEDLTADTQITMTGGTVGLVYGANFSSDLTGNTKIDIQDGKVLNQVFGGGVECAMVGNVEINVAKADSVKWKVYAGGVADTGSTVTSTEKPVVTVADGIEIDLIETITIVEAEVTPEPTKIPEVTVAPTEKPVVTEKPTVAPTVAPTSPTSPETGDSSNIIWIVVVAVVAVAGLGFLIFKKLKGNK